MKILFWNVRGLGADGRRKQLRELRDFHRVDIVCLQETFKSDFSVGELSSLSEGSPFEWCWTAANGHSGGTLTGVNSFLANILQKECGEFFSSMKIETKADKFTWEVVNIYGPVQTDRKAGFLLELSQKIMNMSWPFLLGGDFNMIRFPWEKSTDNINHTWMDLFNNFILDNNLLELTRKGGKYTWTNKQINLVMSVLDRVLNCAEWDLHYRDASCETITRVGSDHSPIIVNTSDNRFHRQQNFRFKMHWLEQQGFRESVVIKWPIRRLHENIQDFWKEVKAATRRFCRGWGANFQAQTRKNKSLLLEKIKALDVLAESNNLNQVQW
jgi:exonuclease III